MRTVLAALNAKYIHTNPAVRVVAACAWQRGVEDIVIWERTINHRHRQLLRELAETGADVMVFSCYIWNIEMMKALARDLRALCPGMVLAAAGPEVSYHSDEFLAANTAFDVVIAGEGEITTVEWLLALAVVPPERRRQLPASAARLPDLDALPFVYDDLDTLAGRILYYESMRGCPFRCSYCLSSVESGVRVRSLPLVCADLQRFLNSGVRQVKFVDRTFNCARDHAMAVWRYLRDHDNGVTNFHFELAGELMDDDMVAFLATVRPGQFQFEIGVQSCNRETLAAIHRPADLNKLFGLVRKLQKPQNIHIHLDLIAGLPYEDYDSFTRSFNAVYALRPDQFQLGFLKVLKGSAMEQDAARFGIVYSELAPFEVLATNWLCFRELCALSAVADLVDTYYNSGRFSHIIAELCGAFDTPFAFYEALAEYYQAARHTEALPSKIGYYEILGNFMIHEGIPVTPRHQWLCKLDLLLHERPRGLPQWVAVDLTATLRQEILAFFADSANVVLYLPQYEGQEPKHILRMVQVEVFPFHPLTGVEGRTALLFDYERRDLLGRAAVEEIPLPGLN